MRIDLHRVIVLTAAGSLMTVVAACAEGPAEIDQHVLGLTGGAGGSGGSGGVGGTGGTGGSGGATCPTTSATVDDVVCNGVTVSGFDWLTGLVAYLDSDDGGDAEITTAQFCAVPAAEAAEAALPPPADDRCRAELNAYRRWNGTFWSAVLGTGGLGVASVCSDGITTPALLAAYTGTTAAAYARTEARRNMRACCALARQNPPAPARCNGW